jgi:hypothetical protein
MTMDTSTDRPKISDSEKQTRFHYRFLGILCVVSIIGGAVLLALRLRKDVPPPTKSPSMRPSMNPSSGPSLVPSLDPTGTSTWHASSIDERDHVIALAPDLTRCSCSLSVPLHTTDRHTIYDAIDQPF